MNTVLGFVYADVTNRVNVTGVTSAQEVSKNGTVIEVIYTVEFESDYSNGPNIYNVTYKVGTGIKKLEVVSATDTDTFGGHIADPEFAAQFVGMTIESALNGEYDDLGGATYPVTLGAFAGTFDALAVYHNVAYEGATPETEEEMKIPFVVGESVKVIDGPFNNFSGVVDEINEEKKKLKVMVKIFGRKNLLELSYMQVEKEI